mgnify:CR=1 FL=1
MNRKELITETIRLSADDENLFELAIKTDAELMENLDLIKMNIRGCIFDELSDSISNIIGYNFKEPTDEENNKLERLQSELAELITEIKIKNL